MTPTILASNFSFLKTHDEQLVRLGRLAERYFPEDPNTCLLKLRQLSELLAQLTATRVGSYISADEKQFELLQRLEREKILTREVAQLFFEVRKAGNDANHALRGDHRTALACLKTTRQLGLWYHRTFADPEFKGGPFIPPAPPPDESAELKAELAKLNVTLSQYQATHKQTAQELAATQARLKVVEGDQAVWEQLASEAEHANAAIAAKLAQMQAAASAQSQAHVKTFVVASTQASKSVELDEADTRVIIDQQLRSVGWDADTINLRYSKGSRPAKGKNQAIAEWPTETGPADYVLFAGLVPVATVEAKRKNKDVSAFLKQAKRYSQGFELLGDMQSPGGPWGHYQIPFSYSSNGRPYLKQLATKSGTWFCDIRRPSNLGHALDGWHTPEGLVELLKRDEAKADAGLKEEPFNYGFPLRPYQRAAIQAVEAGIAAGQRSMLLAMATGTGKTKTCVALIYRLLKLQRFRRILFLVDRSALGEQAADAFKDTRMESLQRFADVFGIKELEEAAPDTDTKVHIATIQGMVQRLLYASNDATLPAVDQYDCIIVDECHRGYLLDRQLSDTEMTFRGFDDYVSKYRRVLEYFDAFKVGLTATPALHTVDIFGNPIFSYSYREAVIDGYLVDHEPPFSIQTELSSKGIVWAKGADVQAYDPATSEIELFKAPDDIKMEVDDFNKKVITESFNRVVCEFLATELEPASRRKTLIFCANDAHADLVVVLLKEAFKSRYGTVDDDAVVKITDAADKPLKLIRLYKNERMPNVAVTVDLLSTGIDVPEICNIVFLRRIKSRILFDQMLGRATRLCDEIGKESFRIFDAVRLYEALKSMTAMKPVVVDPNISFSQLTKELAALKDAKAQSLVRDQFIAKFNAKRRHITDESAKDFEIVCGMTLEKFSQQLKAMKPEAIAAWFVNNPDLGEILDRRGPTQSASILVSDHPDALKSTGRGYGNALKPDDYLKAFTEFLNASGNQIPALNAVLTRPRDLTRKQLKELRMALDHAGYSENSLHNAYRDTTNQDIAAGVIGYIRQAALGDALIPYEQRVDQALSKILGSQKWSGPQEEWLRIIASQTKVNLLVDREALSDDNLIFRTQGGGFDRLNRIFDGQLEPILNQFNESLWPNAAASKGR
jgi:type I restriction enzyme, R subunit